MITLICSLLALVFARTVGLQGFMGPQGEEIVDATSLAARLGAAIVDIEVRRVAGENPCFTRCACTDVYTRLLLPRYYERHLRKKDS